MTSFVGTGGFVAGAGAISVTAPSGGAQGDLILLFISTANQAPPSTPTLNGVAMTAIDNIGVGTGGAVGAVALYEYRAVRGTVDYAAAVGDSGSYQAAVMIYLRSQHATTPIAGTPAKRVDTTPQTTVTWPNPGTPSSGQFVVQAIALDQDANNTALDVFSTTPTNTGYVANGVIGDTTFDTGAITNAGSGGGLWIGIFNSSYALSGGVFATSTTHAQIAFIVDTVAASNATFTTTTGSATSGAGQGAFTGTADITLTTTTGDAASGAGQGAFTGTVSATLTTTTGDAASAGGTGEFTGTVSATFTTTTGDAASAGGQGAFTGTTGSVDATLTTTLGTGTAGGGTGAFTGTADAAFTTTTGTATAAGGTGSMVAGISATGGTASGTGWVDPTNATGAPNDTYATWTTEVDAATSEPLIVSNFGTWADIPAGATIESVEIRVQHHESVAGSPLEFVSAQAYLGATPLGTATNLTLSLTDRDDVITPSLTLADLQGNTLAVRIIGDRV